VTKVTEGQKHKSTKSCSVKKRCEAKDREKYMKEFFENNFKKPGCKSKSGENSYQNSVLK
jgi:hypothetical protein